MIYMSPFMNVYTKVRIDLDNYINFCSGCTRRAATGMYLKQNVIPRASTFRDSFLQRIVNMWNVLPIEIKTVKSISSFKEKLKNLLYFRLNNIFNQDKVDTYKLICPKCRSSNVYTVCSCSFSFNFLFVLFLLLVFCS